MPSDQQAHKRAVLYPPSSRYPSTLWNSYAEASWKPVETCARARAIKSSASILTATIPAGLIPRRACIRVSVPLPFPRESACMGRAILRGEVENKLNRFGLLP